MSYALAEVERFRPILSSASQIAGRGREDAEEKLLYHKDTEGRSSGNNIFPIRTRCPPCLGGKKISPCLSCPLSALSPMAGVGTAALAAPSPHGHDGGLRLGQRAA